jgi:hypothetical protein
MDPNGLECSAHMTPALTGGDRASHPDEHDHATPGDQELPGQSF